MTKAQTALTEVAPLQAALTAATEAGDLDRLRDIKATAAALQKGARARGMGISDENKAAELVLRSERAMGQVLAQLKVEGRIGPGLATKGLAPADRKGLTPDKVVNPDFIPLDSLGVTKHDSSLWQRLAALSDHDFEALLAAKRSSVERIAKVDFYRLAAAVTDDRPDRERVKAVQELLGDEQIVPNGFPEFKAAAEALDVTQLTVEDLMELAAIVKSLATAYNAEKARRQA